MAGAIHLLDVSVSIDAVVSIYVVFFTTKMQIYETVIKSCQMDRLELQEAGDLENGDPQKYARRFTQFSS